MRWMLFALLTLQVATCGQKGPLYLPEPTTQASASVPQAAGRISGG